MVGRNKTSAQRRCDRYKAFEIERSKKSNNGKTFESGYCPYNDQFYKIKQNFSQPVKISIIKEPLYHLNTKNNISTIRSKEQKYYANCVRNNIIPIEKV